MRLYENHEPSVYIAVKARQELNYQNIERSSHFPVPEPIMNPDQEGIVT